MQHPHSDAGVGALSGRLAWGGSSPPLRARRTMRTPAVEGGSAALTLAHGRAGEGAALGTRLPAQYGAAEIQFPAHLRAPAENARRE